IHPAVVKQNALAVRIVDELVPADGPPLAFLVGMLAGLLSGVLDFDPGVGRQLGKVCRTTSRSSREEGNQTDISHGVFLQGDPSTSAVSVSPASVNGIRPPSSRGPPCWETPANARHKPCRVIGGRRLNGPSTILARGSSAAVSMCAQAPSVFPPDP